MPERFPRRQNRGREGARRRSGALLWGLVLACAGAGCRGPSSLHHPNAKVHAMPAGFLTFLGQEVAGDREQDGCPPSERAPLWSDHFYELPGGRLLVLVALPDYLCSSSKSFVPVLVDGAGKVQWGGRLTGYPTLFVQDQAGAFWLVSQSAVEGSSPSLFRSTDGVAWTEISLPEQRQVDCCFEFLNEMCIDAEGLTLRFQAMAEADEETKTEWWHAPMATFTPQPRWRQIVAPGRQERSCPHVALTPGSWRRQETQDMVVFSRGAVVIHFPKWL